MGLYDTEVGQYIKWYRSLKPGDEVYYHKGFYSRRPIITTVAKITETGMVRTENGELFDTSGKRRGGRPSSASKLEAVTPEIREKENRGNAIAFLRGFDRWQDLPTETLLKILDTMKEV